MSDISITQSAVARTASSKVARGTAGATITAGQAVYLDATTDLIKLADADAVLTAAAVGIAEHGALSGQPLSYVFGRDITLSGMTAGQVYVVSTTAGGIAPYSDLGSGDFPTILGLATSATNLKMPEAGPLVCGVAKP
jgi:hypothetical protein